jgi:hypothetical protein
MPAITWCRHVERAVIVERPLSIAEIFDRTVTVVVQRWKVLTVLAILWAAPDALITALAHGHPDNAALFAQFLVDASAGTIVGAAIVLVAGAAESPRSPLAVLRAALARFWSLLGATILLGLLYLTVFVLFAIPGFVAARIAGNVAGIVVTVTLAPVAALPWLAASLAFPIVVLEDVGAGVAIRRAIERARRDSLRRACLLGLALLVFFLGVPLAVIAGLETLAELPGLWFVDVFESLLNTLLLGTLSTSLLTVTALDYRLRSEGTDLAAALDVAGGSARG